MRWWSPQHRQRPAHPIATLRIFSSAWVAAPWQNQDGSSPDTYDPGTASGFPDLPTVVRGTVTASPNLDVYTPLAMFQLICNDFDANGLNVQRVSAIHHRLMDGYGMSPTNAGQTVAYAVEYQCPQYKGAMLEAQRQYGSTG